MRLKPFFGSFEPLRVRLSVITERIYGYAAARHEPAPDLDIFWRHQPDEILHNYIYAVLMKISVIPEAEQI
ncbi:hypothetical protein SDC9_206934 [bioreactor metagenome]|uniref:Uncharacterized protein n=1 Tax=bioreactor metagenome TaxID=1076179 RepID=A0A645JFU0_9ZZZZ